MTLSEFNRLIKAAGMERHPAIPACRLVLVHGFSFRQAEIKTNINRGTISRIIKRVPVSVCKACDSPIYKKD